MFLSNIVVSLPKFLRLFLLGSIFIGFLFYTFSLPAFATHDKAKETPDNRVGTTVEGSGQDSGQPQYLEGSDPVLIPTPTTNDLDIQQAQFWNPKTWVSGIIGLITGPIASAVKAAFTTLMDFIFEMISGVSFGNIGLLQEKLEAYQNGVTDPSQIPSPGLIDYAAVITDEALQLNVPINSTQYFASINPLSEGQVQAGGVDELAESTVILEVWQRARNVATRYPR